jgi:type VI secretion system FHA domain protein
VLLALSVISAHGAGMGPTAYKIFDERGGSIGRLDTNDWSLPDPAKIVSSRHAEIHFASGGFYLQDLSTNGTFINTREQLIERDAGHWLADGDRILIGEYEILVQIIDDGIPALETGEPPREAHGDSGSRAAHARQQQPQRSEQDATDPMGLTRLRPDLTAGEGSDEVDPLGGGLSGGVAPGRVTVPTDWQITRFRNLPPATEALPAAVVTPAASVPPAAEEEESLTPEDAVTLLLALGVDPTGIELDPHQFAMLAGIRAGYNAMLQRFDPNLLARLAAHTEEGFRRLFGEAFSQAYNRALDEQLLMEHKG